MTSIFHVIKEYIKKLHYILETPGALQARRKGIFLDMYRLVYGFSSQGISPATVLDIGANRGMFSRTIHYFFPHAKIFAFEPLHECFDELKKLSAVIPDFETVNIALSDSIGETEMHRSSFDYSSSLLEMGEIHKKAFPHTAGASLEKIQRDTLDNVLQGRKFR